MLCWLQIVNLYENGVNIVLVIAYIYCCRPWLGGIMRTEFEIVLVMSYRVLQSLAAWNCVNISFLLGVSQLSFFL